jgi:sulfur carrier protein ThiS
MKVVAELVQARRTETVDLASAATGLELLERLGLAPDAHLLLRGETPIPVDAVLSEGERLRILSVVSGGS